MSFWVCCTAIAQTPKMIDWKMSECDGSPYDRPYHYAVDDISTKGNISYFTFKFVENCALVPIPSLSISDRKINIKLDNKIPDHLLTFCDCCYSLSFTIEGKIDKDFKFYYDEKEILNLGLQDAYKHVFKEIGGVVFNRYNKYWQKEGMWIEGEDTIIYSNGLPVSLTYRNKYGNLHYRNLLEEYYVIQSDTFDRVDKYGRKQGLHIGAGAFLNDEDDINMMSFDSISFFKNGRKLMGYVPLNHQHYDPCYMQFEKVEFRGKKTVRTYHNFTDENYVYNEVEKKFKLKNMEKAAIVVPNPMLYQGDTLVFGRRNALVDFEFYGYSIFTPNGRKISLLNTNDYGIKPVLIGMDTLPQTKTVKIYTDKPNFKMSYLDDPNTMKDDPEERLVHIFQEKGTYILRYTKDECYYEEHLIEFDPKRRKK